MARVRRNRDLEPELLAWSDRALSQIVDYLNQGMILAIPTDTVHGLVCLPKVPGTTDRLFELKNRPDNVNLQVLVGSIIEAHKLFSSQKVPGLLRLANAFWPGPLTIVDYRNPTITWNLGESSDTIGVRVPASDLVQEICGRVGPLVATSVNMHGETPLSYPREIVRAFPGGDDRLKAVVVMGHRSHVQTFTSPESGLASTVVDVTGGYPRILRSGSISLDQISNAWDEPAGF